jgi:hypothetical protein
MEIIMDDKSKVVVVCDDNSYSIFHDKVLDFLKWLKEQIYLIPIEYQSNAKIDIEPIEEYGVLECSVKIYYTRPKTKKELKEDSIKKIEEKEKRINYLRRELDDIESS